MRGHTHGEELTLTTSDGVRLSAVHRRGAHSADTAIVLGHGFSGRWDNPRGHNIAAVLCRYGDVVAIDFRGHGRSGGRSTVGDKEILDIAAAVDYARRSGYASVRLLGFSMGAAVAIRYAAHFADVDAVAAVSGPATWYYKGTSPMRWVHRAIENPAGRAATRWALRTRIDSGGWPTVPTPPWQAAARIAPTPLLVVHGTSDAFFPLRHAHALHDAAVEPKQLWIERGMGHAESATTPALAHRLGRWLVEPSASGDVSQTSRTAPSNDRAEAV